MSKTNEPILELEAKVWCKIHDIKGESAHDCCSAYMSDADRECVDFTESVRCIADIVMDKATNPVYKDGVYIIYKDGHSALLDGNNSKDNVKYVGLKIGGKCIAVALKDVSDEEITLTVNEDETSYKKYVDNSIDTLADWNGQENTDHLKQIGLNPEIKLEEGEYIAAAGEFSFINLFVKSINEALKAVGGEPLSGWYWTSSEGSEDLAWNLNLGFGTLYTFSKVSPQGRARAVAAFSL